MLNKLKNIIDSKKEVIKQLQSKLKGNQRYTIKLPTDDDCIEYYVIITKKTFNYFTIDSLKYYEKFFKTSNIRDFTLYLLPSRDLNYINNWLENKI